MDPERLQEILEYFLENTHKLPHLSEMSDADNIIMYLRRLIRELD